MIEPSNDAQEGDGFFIPHDTEEVCGGGRRRAEPTRAIKRQSRPMLNKTAITLLSLLAAVVVYLWMEKELPHLSPQVLYGVAAFAGFVIGFGLNYAWGVLKNRGDKK